jgi:hypothetical protein
MKLWARGSLPAHASLDFISSIRERVPALPALLPGITQKVASFFFVVLGFELRTLHLLGRRPAA